MIDKNYAKLETGISSPQWLRLPIRLVIDIIIEGITHSAGSYLSTNTESVLRELGYKPVVRTPKPTSETAGYDYRETWTDDGTAPQAQAGNLSLGPTMVQTLFKDGNPMKFRHL